MKQARFTSFIRMSLLFIIALVLMVPSLAPVSLTQNHHMQAAHSHAHSHDHEHMHHHQDAGPESALSHSHSHHPADHTHDVPAFAGFDLVTPVWPYDSLNAALSTLVLQDPLYRVKRPPKV